MRRDSARPRQPLRGAAVQPGVNLLHAVPVRDLPPFDALLAFDAVLAHGTVTAAAEALGVTGSAVSHRLRRLAAFFGAPLLVREGIRFVPTAAGAALAARLPALLDELAALQVHCRAAARPRQLRVGLGAALSDNWLVRRLPGFTACHPELAVELIVVESHVDVPADLDVRIAWVRDGSARASSTERPLFAEHVFPVCAPALLPGGRPLADPRRLLDLPLLHKGPTKGSGAEWLWQTWFDHLGVHSTVPAGLRFATIGTAIAAALGGAGVALGRSLLVHDALRDGRLVRVLAPEWDIPSSKIHLLRWPAALIGDARVLAFSAWMTAAVAETVEQRRTASPSLST